jgi:SEC-C motif-containing protein
LTVDGASVHGWGFTSDMIIDSDGASIGIRFNSVALRNSDATRFPWMKDSEELVVISALSPAKLHLSTETPSLAGTIDGYLFLREINQVTENSRKESSSEKKELGRNSPCACGSGKRFKRCCGSG